jgi:outer membrane immunogenic protein
MERCSMLHKSLLLSAIAPVAVALAIAQGQAGTLMTPGGPAYDWTGPYVGAHVGYLTDRSDYSSNFGALGAGPSGSIDLDGVFGGPQAGYNFQVGPFVFGAEADFSVADVNGTAVPDPTSLSPSQLKANIDWTSTLRARAGYAWDNFLFYGTGGLAVVRAEASDNNIGFGFNTGRGSATFFGWVGGAGVEVALYQNVTGKFEYQHIGVGRQNIAFSPSPLVAPVNGSIDRFEIGLNYKF